MKLNDINNFIDYLKVLNKNKFYISEEFISWYVKKYSKTEFEAIDIFEINLKKIHNRISEYIKVCDKSYLIPQFKYDDYEQDTLINSRFKYNKNDQTLISRKIDFREKIYNLLKLLDWRELEKLSKIILKENHINEIKVTRSRNDQGIDFYGYFRYDSDRYLPRFYKFLNFRIIGQVKHSVKNVGVDHQKVASFGTEINKLRKTNDSSYFENLDEAFLNSELPIIGIFITNSYYPRKAEDFAKEYGIIYWNGRQIAEDLCCEPVLSQITDTGTNEISLDKFKEYINLISE